MRMEPLALLLVFCSAPAHAEWAKSGTAYPENYTTTSYFSALIRDVTNLGPGRLWVAAESGSDQRVDSVTGSQNTNPPWTQPFATLGDTPEQFSYSFDGRMLEVGYRYIGAIDYALTKGAETWVEAGSNLKESRSMAKYGFVDDYVIVQPPAPPEF